MPCASSYFLFSVLIVDVVTVLEQLRSSSHDIEVTRLDSIVVSIDRRGGS